MVSVQTESYGPERCTWYGSNMRTRYTSKSVLAFAFQVDRVNLEDKNQTLLKLNNSTLRCEGMYSWLTCALARAACRLTSILLS